MLWVSLASKARVGRPESEGRRADVVRRANVRGFAEIRMIVNSFSARVMLFGVGDVPQKALPLLRRAEAREVRRQEMTDL